MPNFQKHDEVVLTTNLDLESLQYYNEDPLTAGDVFIVSRVNTNKTLVKANDRNYWIPHQYLEQVSSATTSGTSTNTSNRKLGEVPEGMISPEDPGIAWLWEDAAKLAERENHCGAYDRLCNTLGIPGRIRNFDTTIQIKGITINAKDVPARSEKEAIEIVKIKLGILPETDNQQ